MIVTFYLDIENGERHTIINHTLTKESEVEWLLKQVKEKIQEILLMKSPPSKLSMPSITVNDNVKE